MKRIATAAFAFSIFPAVTIPTAAVALTLTKVSEAVRPTSAVGEQISGITWAGGELYYAVDDNDNKLYPLTLHIGADGTLTKADISMPDGIAVSGANDMEGCAFDPATGNIWISEEANARIREIAPDGTALRSVPVPAIMRQYYGNFSLEALTISGDGKTMWTCNEESLKCDGTNSTKTVGATVRLTRFVRESVYDNWTAVGQWAYLTQPIGSDPWIYNGSVKGRSGVSALAALPDGRLLVLERTLWGNDLWDSTFYNRIYLVDGSASDGGKATDVSALASLKSADFKYVKKTQLFNKEVGWVNYEGMCLGPRLSDGSLSVILVADGGNCTCKIMTQKLSGLDEVDTLYFDSPSKGAASIVGGPYRFMKNSSIEVSLSGVEYPSAYTNNTAVCTDVTWNGCGQTGSGSEVSFTVTGDGRFTWSLTDLEPAETAIDEADGFETYKVGALVEEGGVGAWSGSGEVVAAAYAAPSPAGWPMPRDAHAQVLDVDTGVRREFACTTNGSDRLEMMVTVRRRSADESDEIDEAALLAVCCDSAGALKLLCRNASGEREWVRLDDATYENGQWLRMSFELATNDAGETFALVGVNGRTCETALGLHSPYAAGEKGGAWHRVGAAAQAAGASSPVRISGLEVRGTVRIDDVIKTSVGYEPEYAESMAEIDGVPVAWLEAHGFAKVPSAPFPSGRRRALGYTVGDVYVAGLDPETDEPFNVTDIRFDDEGRLRISFNGVREDLADAARDKLYPVYRMKTLGGEETPVAGTTAIDRDAGVTVWTSSERIEGAKGFYRVEVER